MSIYEISHNIWEEGLAVGTETSAKQKWTILGKAEQAHTSGEPCLVSNPRKKSQRGTDFGLRIEEPPSAGQPAPCSWAP